MVCSDAADVCSAGSDHIFSPFLAFPEGEGEDATGILAEDGRTVKAEKKTKS